MKEIKIKLNNGKELVAQFCDCDGVHPEIVVCIQDNGIAVQDICIIRPHEEDCERIGTDIDCLVWADECNEDYTDKFIIPQYEEDTSTYDKYNKKYPLLSSGNDPVILYDNLDEEDLKIIESTLKEYEDGILELIKDDKGKYWLAQDNMIVNGGIYLEILKWYKGMIGADDLAPMFVIPF